MPDCPTAVEAAGALRWMTEAAQRQLAVAVRMADTLRSVSFVAEHNQPCPWAGGALETQIREDLNAWDNAAVASSAQQPDTVELIAIALCEHDGYDWSDIDETPRHGNDERWCRGDYRAQGAAVAAVLARNRRADA